ncbi:MAG: hypothetical protein KGJ13_05815 [Patescibacteria group bacterium]|nr:hypothetical protein [Patescibacteria group bacterium]
MQPETRSDKMKAQSDVGSGGLVRRMPRWKRWTIFWLLAPFVGLMVLPKMLMDIAEEWNFWAQEIGKWWRKL